jgi:predicted peroxiredoxin
MKKKLLIVLATADPAVPEEVAAPIFQATVAAARNQPAELLLTGRTGRLAIKGQAESFRLPGDDERTLYDIIRAAHEAGVIIKVCTPTLKQWGNELIAEIDETVGSSYLVDEVLDKHTVSLTY